uniref:Uncharacterized protein n=1 Tax=Ciona savignyi TaxID=51511 RepID=H2ZA94_CIOSA
MQSIQGTPTRKSMPMYQRTIAVTEYLPFNAKSNRDRTHSSVDDLIGEGIRRKLLSASHEAQCTAAFGGAWTPSTTPTKSERTSSYKPSTMNNRDQSYESSCDEVHDHKLSRELDRLRRRLSDSKKINRTLKEELDLVNKSLQKAKESAVPGYQRSRRSPTDLLADHLSEIRGLRQRLEKSIATNDKLREKLEQQLQNNEDNPEHLSAKMSPNNSMKHDTQEADELRRRLFLLKSENKELLTRLGSEDEAKVAYADAIHELNTLHSHILEKSTQTDMLNRHVEQLQREVRQQTALAGKLETDLSASRAELDSYKHKVEQLQSEKNEATLRGKKAVERTHQLNKELDHMHAQLNECRQLIDSLKCEVDIHEKVERRESAFHQPEIDLSELLAEVRSLRVQLERSINTNSALRKQLEDQLKHPRTPERDVSHTTINIRHLTPPQRGAKMSSSPKSSHSARRKLKLDTLIAEDSAMMTPPASASSGTEELGGKSFPFDSKSIHHQSDHEGFAKIPVTCSTHASEKPLY